MKRILLALVLPLLSALLAAPAAAQVPLDPNRDQGFGATAGLASGAGVSYMEILPSSFGFRGAVALWKLSDSSFVDLGFSGLKVLSDDGRQRVYLIASTSYWRTSEEKTEEVFDDEGNLVDEREVDDVDDGVALGLGAGVELPASERIGISLEALFTYWSRTGALLPLPQIAVHYHF